MDVSNILGIKGRDQMRVNNVEKKFGGHPTRYHNEGARVLKQPGLIFRSLTLIRGAHIVALPIPIVGMLDVSADESDGGIAFSLRSLLRMSTASGCKVCVR